jgi:hypothetical protein
LFPLVSSTSTKNHDFWSPVDVVFQFLKCGNFMHFQNSLKNKNLVEPTHQRLPPSTSSGIWATCCCCPHVPACIHVGDRCHRQLPPHAPITPPLLLNYGTPQRPSIPSPLTFLAKPRSSSCLRSTHRHRASIRVMSPSTNSNSNSNFNFKFLEFAPNLAKFHL